MRCEHRFDMSFTFRISDFGDDFVYYGGIPAIFDHWNDGWRMGYKLDHESKIMDRPHFIFKGGYDLYNSIHECRDVTVNVIFLDYTSGETMDQLNIVGRQNEALRVNAGMSFWAMSLQDFVNSQLHALYPSFTVDDVAIQVDNYDYTIVDDY